MRLALHNPYVLALAAVAALLVIAGLVWTVLAPPAPPQLAMQIADARSVLDHARAQGRIHPLPYAVQIPKGDGVTTDERKTLFMAKLLPLIVAENDRISTQRRQLLTTTIAPAQLNALGLAYGLKPKTTSKDSLLSRVDTLPVSLVLAQAAIESAWGTSRFAQDGNAYFGERTFDPDAPGLTPKRASGFKVKSFDTAQLSVRSYMRTLNTHRAYSALRQRRAHLRAGNAPVLGPDLAQYLKDYSEIGNNYILLIERTISGNDLYAFDQLLLSTH
ncbi:glucosaminidase domain-containing protein [Magnetovibrio sp. PR-2]|uniref:glucosaminidase domain-containing protein n=1 Tax=Magnetovibrio sp. PR-2 TaxID=3120356 RepID=UPI002FCE22C4